MWQVNGDRAGDRIREKDRKEDIDKYDESSLRKYVAKHMIWNQILTQERKLRDKIYINFLYNLFQYQNLNLLLVYLNLLFPSLQFSIKRLNEK